MRHTLCAIATVLAVPAFADTFGPYDDVYLFGDSLSDGGNVAAIEPSFVPQQLYPLGQFTNGDVWATQLGLTASRNGGTNYAYGNARAAENGDVVPDLLAQIEEFKTNTPIVSGNSLGVIWSGGNDFRDLPATAGAPEVTAFIGSIVGTVSTGVQALAAEGISDFVIMGMPDFGALPQFADNAALTDSERAAIAQARGGASFVAGQLNDALLATANGLGAQFFDTNSLFQSLLASVPADNAALRCIDQADCLTNSEAYVFYDDLHPVENVHTILAEAFEETVLGADDTLTPVPLPASAGFLIAGLAGFGVWARRRKSLS